MLFKQKDEKKPEIYQKREEGLHFVKVADEQFVELIGLEYELLKQIELQQNCTYQYVTYGQWSFHQIIEVLCIKYKAKHLAFSTYSISDKPVRALFNLKKKGHLVSIKALLDRRVRERRNSAYHFLASLGEEGEDVILQSPENAYNVHAKVAVLWGGLIPIVIVTSQNLTINDKVESGIILTTEAALSSNLRWLLNQDNFLDKIKRNVKKAKTKNQKKCS